MLPAAAVNHGWLHVLFTKSFRVVVLTIRLAVALEKHHVWKGATTVRAHEVLLCNNVSGADESGDRHSIARRPHTENTLENTHAPAYQVPGLIQRIQNLLSNHTRAACRAPGHSKASRHAHHHVQQQ